MGLRDLEGFTVVTVERQVLADSLALAEATGWEVHAVIQLAEDQVQIAMTPLAAPA